MTSKSSIVLCLSFMLFVSSITPGAFAHQPVMDMAPRWQQGYGGQVRYENRYSDTVLEGSSKVDNPLGRDRSVHKTWLEGVYTFRREVRATIKVPFVYQERISVINGQAVKQKGSGIGDLILGLPLKYYKNRKGSTHNVGFTPSVRLPTGISSGGFPPGDGSTDPGFSLSYGYENKFWYHFYDLFYWVNNQGVSGIDQGDELGFDSNIGIHPYHDNETNSGMFVMLDMTARYETKGKDRGGATGGTRLSLGPVLVLYRRNIMFRAEYKIPVYERRSGSGVARGNELNVGIGITF